MKRPVIILCTAVALFTSPVLAQEDMPAARRILKACAFTYVYASLAALLNLWRWIRFIR